MAPPNEYEHFKKSLEKRYTASGFGGAFEEHVQDIHSLVKFFKHFDYVDELKQAEELKQLVRKSFYIKCRYAGKAYWVRPYSTDVRFPQSETGLMLEQYYKGIAENVYFVDFDAYQSAGITFDDLRVLGVTDKIVIGDEKTWGEYYTGNPGRQPEWRTSGVFRWKLGIDKLEDALLYISQHPNAKDALIKSQVIFKTLQENVSRLCGTVRIGGNSVPDKYNEPAEIIRTLNKEGDNRRLSDWNGKWLYTESGDLVSHKAISKHDLNRALYGKVSLDSNLYDLLGFKEKEKATRKRPSSRIMMPCRTRKNSSILKLSLNDVSILRRSNSVESLATCLGKEGLMSNPERMNLNFRPVPLRTGRL